MATIDTRTFQESFVIHFGTEAARINAYTLASTLVALADAAKAANATINPGFDIEVVVEAVGPGSFKAKVAAIYHELGNLFSKESLKAIVLNVVASYVFLKTLQPDSDIKITVNTDEVIVTQGQTTIIVPRDVHEAAKRIENVPEFRDGISRVFGALERDKEVTDVGITPSMQDKEPPLRIPRDRFQAVSDAALLDLADAREFVEVTDLQIKRAILERGRRRWEFVWRGIRISAPLLDYRFFEKWAAREVIVAPGDALKVRLRVRQTRDPDTGVFVNDVNGYEIVEVLQHIPRARQSRAHM